MTELLIGYVFHLEFRSCVLIAAKSYPPIIPGMEETGYVRAAFKVRAYPLGACATESRSRTEQYPFGDLIWVHTPWR